jgi:hypothetical protein
MVPTSTSLAWNCSTLLVNSHTLTGVTVTEPTRALNNITTFDRYYCWWQVAARGLPLSPQSHGTTSQIHRSWIKWPQLSHDDAGARTNLMTELNDPSHCGSEKKEEETPDENMV